MNNDSNPNNLLKVKISHLIKFAQSFNGVEVHIFINNKFIKMNYAEEQFIEILRKLQQRDLDEVFINQEDCKRVLDELQKSMSPKTFYDPKTTDEERMETAEKTTEIVKSVINQLGVDKQTLDILKAVNQKTVNMLNESPSIFQFIKQFKKNCSEEFLRSIITGYLTSLVINKFPWKSIPVKEKAALASLLCDITLKKEDFAALRDHLENGTPLNQHIKNHPYETAKILSSKKDVVPSETITIIEQHHELPDGTGFPAGIESPRFNQLSTIFIVCQKFTEELFKENFDFQKSTLIIEKMQKIYIGRNFDKAMNALISIVS